MAINTLDGALAGMQYPRHFAKALTGTMVAGRPHSLWGLAGIPGAGTYDTTAAGVALTSATGQIPFSNPTSGNTYIGALRAQATVAGTLLLVDRLWHNGGLSTTITTAQTINSAAWPARDANGSTNGEGVYIGLEVSVVTGAGTPTLTLGYTNSAGTASRTGTNIVATVASSIAGTFYPFGVQAGDLGVRSLESLTLSATWTSGTINLVAYRVLASLDLTAANVPNAIDALTSGFARLFDNTVPALIFIPSTTTSSNIVGQLIYTQG